MLFMIYLDYAATTPLDNRVLDAMLPYFREFFGNPSSIHRYGQKAESAVDDAREKVAAVLHCRPEEILFTSCGSESDNLALRGAALAKRKISGKSGYSQPKMNTTLSAKLPFSLKENMASCLNGWTWTNMVQFCLLL